LVEGLSRKSWLTAGQFSAAEEIPEGVANTPHSRAILLNLSLKEDHLLSTSLHPSEITLMPLRSISLYMLREKHLQDSIGLSS